MFGALGDIAGLMKQAKSMQENMQKMQESLAQQRYEAEAGAGMVRVMVNGKSDLVDLKIDPKAATDVELLEDLIKAAIGAATRKAQDGMKAEVSKLTGGINIPGLSGLLGGGGALEHFGNTCSGRRPGRPTADSEVGRYEKRRLSQQGAEV